MKQPSFQFYPGDWQKEPTLRRCSHAAKGVFIDMLCLMFECDERGYLATAGVAWSDDEIAQAVGGDRTQTLSCVVELVDKGVVARDNRGAIYCRRMVRDEHKRRACSEAGKRGGGNPTLTYKGVSKGDPKGVPKRNAKASSSSSSSSSDKEEPPNPQDAPIVDTGGGTLSDDYVLTGNPKTPTRPVEAFEALRTQWNTLPNVRACHSSNPSRIRAFQARLKDAGGWDWRKAFEEWPAKCRCFPTSTGWIPTIDWFLRPGTLSKIMEGEYGFTQSGSRIRPGTTGAIYEAGAVRGDGINGARSIG